MGDLCGCRRKMWRLQEGNESFHLCAGGILFFILRDVITEEADEQTTVIFDGRINRTWEMIRVKTIAVGLVVLLVAWVINEESIGCWGLTNDDTIHCMSLMVRS